jgi:hypothetical protein
MEMPGEVKDWLSMYSAELQKAKQPKPRPRRWGIMANPSSRLAYEPKPISSLFDFKAAEANKHIFSKRLMFL